MIHQVRCLAFLLALVVPAIGPVLAGPDLDPRQGLFADEWSEIYLAGGKVGYMHSTMTREGDRIKTKVATVLRMGRVESPVEITTEQQTVETIAGEPLRFTNEMQAATMKTVTAGVITGGKVTVKSSQFGMEQQQEYDFPKGALMSWGLYRESLVRGFAPGTEYTLEAYTPELRTDAAVKAKTTVGEWEKFRHGEKVLKGQKVTMVLATPMGEMTVQSWVDDSGRPLKAIMPAPGLGDMVMLTTDQKTALADYAPPELFMRTTIRSPRKIDRDKVRRITYRLRGTKEGADLSDLPDTGMQRVVRQDTGSVELVVERQAHSHSSSRPPSAKPLQKEQLKEYLGSNLTINTDDPKLVELARHAGGGEKDPYKLGDKLRRFVTDFVVNKNLNVGFATASEVARTREGDCSEHGVLLAALGRLNGLPSRVAVGIAYVPLFGEAADIFGYHLWTQFYIDGRWVDFDAALAETECSPARITLATSSLHDTGLAEMSLPLLSKIGVIDLNIVSLE